MKRIINTEKINLLIKKSGKKQKDLATFIKYPESNLSQSLTSSRTIPMGYVFSIAKFFEVPPYSITESVQKEAQKAQV